MKWFRFLLICLILLIAVGNGIFDTNATDLVPNIAKADWLVLGPFDNPLAASGWGECQGYDFDFLWELGGEGKARPEKKKITAGKTWVSVRAKKGRVDFTQIYGQVENCVAYAYLEIDSPTRQTVALRLGSDDGIKIWCNGELVLNHHIHRPLNPEDEAIRLHLQPGSNRLLLKVDQGDGGWEFAARLASMQEEEDRWRTSSERGLEVYLAEYIVSSGRPVICIVAAKPATAMREEILLTVKDSQGKAIIEKSGFSGEAIELSLPDGSKGVYLIQTIGGGSLQGKSAQTAVLVGEIEEISNDLINQARSIADQALKDKKLTDPVKRQVSATINYWANQLEGKMDSSLTTKERNIRAVQDLISLSHAVKEHMKGAKTYHVGIFDGIRQWAYQSKIDGSYQPYSVYLPKAYDSEKEYSLVVCLHGYSGDDYGAVQQLLGEYRPDDFIVAAPLGRGDMGYRVIGELDVIDVMKEIQDLYSINPDRVYLTGWSMGGLGTWRIGQFYADRFAAVASFCGWTGISFLSNMYNLPTLVAHGDVDQTVPVYWDQMAVGALKEYGAPITYHELAGVDHNVWAEWIKGEGSQRLFEYFRSRKRDPWPKRVTLTIDHLRYGKHYWVEMLEMIAPASLGSLEAEVADARNITVKTKNVKAFALDLGRPDLAQTGILTVNINGVDTETRAGGSKAFFCFDQENNLFINREAPERKRARNEGGGIADLFMRPLYIVYGTSQEDKIPELKRMAEVLSDWSVSRYVGIGVKVGKFLVKPDTEVTAEDIRDAGLLLVGSPEQNQVVARIEKDLPVTWIDSGIGVNEEQYPGAGLILVYPNPLAPQNLVGIISLPFSAANNERLALSINFLLRAYGLRGEDTATVTTPDLLIFSAPERIIKAACYDMDWEELTNL